MLTAKTLKWLNGNWVWNVIWRRTLRTFEVEQAMCLHQVLQEVRLDHTKPVEGMDPLQRWEIYCEILEYLIDTQVWKSMAPQKLQTFIWLAIQQKLCTTSFLCCHPILSLDQTFCPFCNTVIETSNNMLIH